jgi:E3 ubiquitin-protein ligase HERC3
MAVTRSQRAHAGPRRPLGNDRRQSTESFTIPQRNCKGTDREYEENYVSSEVRSCQRTRDAGRDSDDRMTRTNLSMKRKNDMYSTIGGNSHANSENEDMNPQVHSAGPLQFGKKQTLTASCPQPSVSCDTSQDSSPRLSGLLATVPREALEQILGYLDPRDLANLNATGRYFIDSGITEQVARHHMKNIPRARCLNPHMHAGETQVSLLQFVQGQSKAAAQSTAVALGAYHSVCLFSAENEEAGKYGMYSFGRGFHGQIGTGSQESTFSPTLIEKVEKQSLIDLYKGTKNDVRLAVVQAGSCHSAAISRRGELFMWGLASSGELGQGSWSPTEVGIPRLISGLGRTRIVSVCAGANHTLAISESGQLWSCGRGRCGQLGHGHFHDEAYLSVIEAIQNYRIVSVAAGKFHSMALAADGKLFTWGAGSYGQLGHGITDDQSIPKCVSSLNPTDLPPPDRITAISAGGYHSFALTVSGNLLATGRNQEGQLGIPGLTGVSASFDRVHLRDLYPDSVHPRVIQVQCGYLHSLALVQVDGRKEVRATGSNSYGQLGIGSQSWARKFTKVNIKNETSGIISINSGDWHCAAITEDGSLYTWGRGDCGQLGHGDDKSRWVPTKLENFVVVHPDMTLRRSRKDPKEAIILRSPAPEVKRRRRN